MKRLLCVMVCVPGLALAAGESSPSAAGKEKAFSAALAPGKIHEECQKVEAGGQRRYAWKSDAPVDFNVHFHRGNDVTYPVRRDATRGESGTFSAKAAEDYCWMWTARDKAAKIEGRIEAK